MYIVIRKYELFLETKEQFIRDVQERLILIINRVSGFRAYSLLEGGENEVVVISTFHTLADAKASAQLTGEWVAEHTNSCIEGFSKLAAGQVRVQSEAVCLSPTPGEELLQGCF